MKSILNWLKSLDIDTLEYALEELLKLLFAFGALYMGVLLLVCVFSKPGDPVYIISLLFTIGISAWLSTR